MMLNKTFHLLLLSLIPLLGFSQANSQYPDSGNKIRLGFQTSGNGLIWRDTQPKVAGYQPINNKAAWIVLDTVNNKFYHYKNSAWTLAGGQDIDTANLIATKYNLGFKLSLADTQNMLSPYWRSDRFSGILPVANGGTGSATQNFVDLTTTQSSIAGAKTFTSTLNLTNADGLNINNTNGKIVGGGTTAGRFFFNNTDLSSYFVIYGSAHATNPHDIAYVTNTSNIFNFNNDGNFGVGIGAPTEKLHVVGNGLFTGSLSLGTPLGGANGGTNLTTFTAVGRIPYASSTTALTTNSNLLYDGTRLRTNQIAIGDTASNTVGITNLLALSGGSGAGFTLKSSYDAPTLRSFTFLINAVGNAGFWNNNTSSYAYFINNSNNFLGIGTASPGEKLDVAGNIQLLNGGYLRGSLYSASKMTIDNDVTIAANRDILLSPTGSTNAFIVKQTSGNVGIGTTSPTQKLEVNGKIALFADVTRRALEFDASNNLLVGGGFNTVYFTASNVGIGTISPGSKLEIFNSSSIIGETSTLGLLINNNGSIGQLAQIGFGYSESRVGAAIGGVITNGGGSTASDLFFATRASTDGAVSPTERMRITSSGSVAIGATAITDPYTATGGGWKTVQFGKGGILGAYGNADESMTGFNTYVSAPDGANKAIISNVGGTAIRYFEDRITFNTLSTSGTVQTQTERMRITSGGVLCVGGINTDPAANATNGIALTNDFLISINRNNNFGIDIGRNGTDGAVASFRRGSTQVGTISVTGSLTSYNVNSDYRLKQDFKNYNGLDLISAIKTYDYEWKSDKSRMYGVVAHELQEVIPYAVQGEKDGKEMQGVDYSKIVPILIKSVQELSAEIDILKQEIINLKNK